VKLTLLTGEYPPQPGGVGDYTRCLAAALSACGHQLSVLTMRDGALIALQFAPAQAEQLLALPPTAARLDWSPRCWPAVIAALDRLRPAWLHIQYQTGAYEMRPGINLLPWRLRALPGRPQIAVTFHDLLQPYLFPKAGPARAWVNRRLAADADAVVATNHADAAALRRLVAQPATFRPQLIPIGSNIAVAPPPGYRRAPWRAQLGVGPDELLVAYFGLLSPSKGVDLLLSALPHLTRPWRLLLIGGAATAPQDVAYAAALRAQIDAMGLGARVIATGHVPDAEVSAHLLAADCVALPFRDGASFRRGSLLAALAHGCPVVTTPPAEPAEAALLSEAALFAPVDAPAALAAALTRLATDAALGAALSAAGQRLAARFSWTAIAARHAELYAA
jgi:glycosyltransferase involved in cell wall biosynthesis